MKFLKRDWIFIVSYWIIIILIILIIYKLGLMGDLGFYITNFG